MLLSLNWLKDFLEIPGKIDALELGRRLTLHTVEIENVEDQLEKFKNVVIGKIVEINPHSNADKLQVTKVDVGGKDNLNIVCGAKNIEVGQMVPVALPGAILPNGIEINEGKIRGEVSEGMLCAEDEIGLGADHDGIMILDKKAKKGQNLAEYLKLNDTVFEVDNKSLTNRPDLLSHIGIAREISVFLNSNLTKKFNKINNYDILETEDSLKELKVSIENNDLCPRYMAIEVEGVEIKESPKWMQDRLSAVGVRPINNMVDITNYIMIECGQPMHAFDSSLIKEIIVRRARKGEKIITLDGEERRLDDEMLVIADGEKPVAVAGVMGGVNSEINPETKNVILESANFEGVRVRKTSQRLGIRTESSMRFEKSLDPNLCSLAIRRAWDLIKEVCPKAQISSKLIDIKSKDKVNFGFDVKPIKLEVEWIKKRLGEDVDSNKITDILEELGFGITKENDEGVLEVEVPTWRATKDVSIKEDLLEEVGRIIGYDNIKPAMPRVELGSPEINQEKVLEKNIKDILSLGLGLSESYNYVFTSEEKLKKINIDPASYIRLANSMSENHTLLKQNLSTNLFDNIRLNQANFDNVSLFEIGMIFMDFSGDINKDDKGEESLPYQERRIGIIEASNKEDVFRKVKGKVESLLDRFDLKVEFVPSEPVLSWGQEGVCANVKVLEKEIGFVCQVDDKVLKNLGIKKKVAVCEIRFSDLFNLINMQGEKKYKSEGKYPALERDLAFVVDNKILYNDIRHEIIGFSNLITRVDLFDVYQGGKLEKNKKNLGFHIIYQSPERTLKADEVENVQNELIKKLEEKYEAHIRNF
ncbi:phenylalanine--tRNA ligase subunit beta [bacterium]|nr:phenylalanine--tRNA ligase subunit beta [bacterium]